MVRVLITDLINKHRQRTHILFSSVKTIIHSHIRQARLLRLQYSRKEAIALRREKGYLYLDDFEYRLAVAGMNHFRNYLIRTGKPTEDVDALLIKLLKAPIKRIKH